MLKSLAVFVLILVGASSAQAQIPGKSVQSFTTRGGTVFHKGDTVKIGRGTGVNGSFRYIAIPANVFTGQPQKPFTSNFAGSAVVIKDLKAKDSGPDGIQTMAVIKGEGLLSGCILINPAEEAGEIRTKYVLRPKATLAPAAPIASANITDELLKLKQLLDAKVLTPAEFAAQKNRLLNQQGSAVAAKTSELSGKTQTENDITFKLVSASGDTKNQTVTITLSFNNAAANKTNFNTQIRSCSSPDGEEFSLKAGMIGNDTGSKTLFTGAPIRGTYVFAGILPKVNAIKLLAVPYHYYTPSSKYEEGQVEFRDIFINWK